jgi:cell fate (sporulation/competence/biofilm development) regulator YlbF (YheA/YmcA/DUF963 family)
MKNKETFTLIDGIFSNEEAKDILMNIISTKIHFHEKRDFSSQERFGKKDEIAQRRIPELKESLNIINEKIAEAKSQNKKLLINSELTISFSND